MKYLYSTTRSSDAQQGYTLVELLVAISLGSVVLAFLGGVLLVSEMRVSANIQRNLNTKDAANRAIDLIRREGTLSSRIGYGTGRGGTVPLSNCINSAPLIYYQPGDSTVCYKAVAPSEILNSTLVPPEYKVDFKGPCVLVRVGPPYKPDGGLDNSSAPIVQVLLDGLAMSDSCNSPSNSGFNVQMESQTLSRSGKVNIRIDPNMNYSFNTLLPLNRLYDGNDFFNTCVVSTATACGFVAERASSIVLHYKPENSASLPMIPGDPTKENVFYFKYPYSGYTLREGPGSLLPCTFNNCYVQNVDQSYTVSLTNVDALIFPDKEIRPTR
jgi:prepilin-type N-terminal cleavage/methylation domain-containing protein